MGALAGLGAAARLRALSMMRNSSSPNFGDPFFHALRRCRSEQHTSRGRKRKIRIFEPSRGSDTPQTRALKNFRFLWRYTLLLAVPQAVPSQVVADSPLAGEGSWVQPDRETLLTRLERVYAAGDCTASPPPKAGIFAEAETGVAARNIAAEIDGGPSDRFDGTGYCFLEFPGQRGSALEGQFFAQPPEVRLAEPDSGGTSRNQAFETERLRDWLDVGLS